MRSRKGVALVEVILAAAILAVVILPIGVSTVSEHALGQYAESKMAVADLAYMKMSLLEAKIRANPNVFDANKYYGFRYDPGDVNDVKHDPEKGYSQDPGTFWKQGYPEVRYQFYVTKDGGLYYVHLLVWRRPKTQGGLIIRNYLFEEVMPNA